MIFNLLMPLIPLLALLSPRIAHVQKPPSVDTKIPTLDLHTDKDNNVRAHHSREVKAIMSYIAMGAGTLGLASTHHLYAAAAATRKDAHTPFTAPRAAMEEAERADRKAAVAGRVPSPRRARVGQGLSASAHGIVRTSPEKREGLLMAALDR